MITLPRLIPEGGAVFCGNHLPAGIEVGVNAAFIHHNKDVFRDDAADFRPER